MVAESNVPISVEIVERGGQQLIRTLRTIRENYTSRVLGPVTREQALRIRDRARRTRSFRNRTGNLRRSIRVEQNRAIAPRTGRFVVGWNVAAGGRRAFYAEFIETGTRYIRPRRFLLRAVQREGVAAKRVMASAIRRRYAPWVRAIR